ncbi:MAG: hypothetical protein CMJ75_01075 [Planctomycetaceae bacterium]|nr:hypothetical protein [Planctomycetaceae bacterium]
MKRAGSILLALLLAAAVVGWFASDFQLLLTTTPIDELGLNPAEIHRNEKGQVTRIVANKTKVTDELLLRLPKLRHLEYLWLADSPISDQAMASLNRLPNLKNLFLQRTQVTGTGAEHLLGLSQLERLVLSECPVDDRGLAAVARLDSLKVLLLNDTRVSDAGVRHIGNMATLVDLDLSGTQVTNQAILTLSKLASLKSLRLHNTRLSGILKFPQTSSLRSFDISANTALTGLNVEKIPSIRMLNLSKTGISDETFRPRSALPELRDLNLSETAITGATLERLLSSCPHLQWLNLADSQTNDLGVQNVSHLKQLRVLLLGRTRISDAAGMHLRQLTSLIDLDLSQTSIGDPGLGELQALTALRRLTLEATQITEERSAELKRALPQLKIVTGVEDPREEPADATPTETT